MSPLVTVYLVNHNYGKYIKLAIDSVLKQTFKDFELIIIDNGSKDNSLNVIKKYSSNEKVSTVFQKNHSLTVTNNIAVRMARGKYIMRLDADDYLDIHALQAMINVLENNKNISVVFPDYWKIDKKGQILEIFRRHDFKKVKLFDQPAHGACTMIRLSYLKEIGGYDESFDRQDGYDLWLRIFGKTKIQNINLPLFYYRKHDSSLSFNEKKLLDVRTGIIAKRSKNLKITKRSLCIIPLRGRKIDKNSIALEQLGSKKVIEWTIDEALQSKNICDVLVSTPDDEVISFIKKRYLNKVIIHKRESRLAQLNSFLDESIFKSAKYYLKSNKKIDLIILRLIESPFINKHHIESAISLISIHNADIILGVRPEIDIFYNHKGKGLVPIKRQGTLKLEADEIYRDAGGIKIINWNWFKKSRSLDNPSIITHIALDKKSSFSISDSFNWQIAKLIAKGKKFND